MRKVEEVVGNAGDKVDEAIDKVKGRASS